MTPRTTTQNLLYWSAALAVALLLSVVKGTMTHWPEGGSIDWRGVWMDVGGTLLTVVPIVAAGFGLPRLGKEQVASLVSKVGVQNATEALHDEVDRQSGIPAPLDSAAVQQIVAAVKAEMLRDPEGDDAPRFLGRTERAIDPTTPQGRATLDAEEPPRG